MSASQSETERQALSTLPGLKLDEPLARHTTFGIGGPADFWIEPPSEAELRSALAVAHEHRVPVTIFGGGSNLLVQDGGVRGLVISTCGLRAVERLPNAQVRAGAGVPTSRLVAAARDEGLGGLERLTGVPGTIGGAVIMNAGTALGEIKDIVVEVASLSLAGGELVHRPAKDCGFVYRGSSLPPDEVVVAVVLGLRPRPQSIIEAEIDSLRRRRDHHEPRGVGSAGSTFKNPPNEFAGHLIEESGLKGTKVGGAQVSPVHANWIVNTGGATSADVLELVERVRKTVKAKTGVPLELEIRVIGEPK